MVTAERLAGPVPARGSGGRAAARGWVAGVATALGGLAGRRDLRLAGVALLALLAVRSSLARHSSLDPRAAVALALAATAPLLIARALPVLALGLPVMANAVFIVLARLAWPAAAITGWLLVLALSPLRLRQTPALVALAAAETSVAAAVFVPDRINATPWDATLAEGLAALIAWWIGDSVRVRRDARVEREDVARRLQALIERDAVARERARIARELHDVVAHHVSTIAVRAATLAYEVDDLPLPARTALTEIADGARAALEDLRAVLGVLRTSADEVAGAPQPCLADLPDLIARVDGAGTAVTLTIAGRQRPLADSVQVCGYRIVQEALTNAVRHAPGSKVRVELVYTPDELTVSVRDEGGAHAPAPVGGGGYGLIGMRERVAMLGGSLRAGPAAAGGFEVVASLPSPGSEGGER